MKKVHDTRDRDKLKLYKYVVCKNEIKYTYIYELLSKSFFRNNIYRVKKVTFDCLPHLDINIWHSSKNVKLDPVINLVWSNWNNIEVVEGTDIWYGCRYIAFTNIEDAKKYLKSNILKECKTLKSIYK